MFEIPALRTSWKKLLTFVSQLEFGPLTDCQLCPQFTSGVDQPPPHKPN